GIKDLQAAHGLPVTGWVDQATVEALQADLAAAGKLAADQQLASTAAIQQTLKLCGFWDGAVDGVWTPELTAAVTEFQIALGVPPTGVVDSATIAAFQEALAALQEPIPDPTPAPTGG